MSETLWDYAMESHWMAFLHMAEAIISIIFVAYVFFAREIADPLVTYGMAILMLWGMYLVLAMTFWNNRETRRIQEKLYRVFVEAPKDEEWFVSYETPDTLIMRFPDGHVYLLEISNIHELEAVRE